MKLNGNDVLIDGTVFLKKKTPSLKFHLLHYSVLDTATGEEYVYMRDPYVCSNNSELRG